MSRKSGSQMFADLINLRNLAGEYHYERAVIAHDLLKDRAWVASLDGGGGDENRAIDRLEEECFADITSFVSLPHLLAVLHHFPDVAQWKEHKFNLKAMDNEIRMRQTTKRPESKKALRTSQHFASPYTFHDLTPYKQTVEYKRVIQRIETDEQELARLRTENAQLKSENKRLRQQNTMLAIKCNELDKPASQRRKVG